MTSPETSKTPAAMRSTSVAPHDPAAAVEPDSARGSVGPVGSAVIVAGVALGLSVPFASGVAHTEWLVWAAIGILAGFSLSGST